MEKTEFDRKKDLILKDSNLSSKSKGRLLYKLFRKYHPNRIIENEIIYLEEFRDFEKLRPTLTLD